MKKEALLLSKVLVYTHKDADKNYDKHYSHLQIRIMALAFVIRKLDQTGKLPDNTLNASINARKYPALEDCGTRWLVDIDKEYNLNAKGQVVEIQLWDICNQIIHSHILESAGSQKRAFKYLFFVSDKKKLAGINRILITDFLKLARKVANSQVTKMRTEYDEEKMKWIITRN